MLDATNQSDPLRELASKSSMNAEEALKFFDTLPVVDIDTIIGTWRGSGLSTGHPLDGMLEALGWYGKEFIDRDHVHPLLFSDNKGALFSLDPKRVSMNLVLKVPMLRNNLVRQALLAARFVLQTHKAKARVRMLEYRGKVSATMIYDDLPICDMFRLVDHDTLLGIMDLKGMKQPFFFKLHRDK